MTSSRLKKPTFWMASLLLGSLVFLSPFASGQDKKKAVKKPATPAPELAFPPVLPGGKSVLTFSSSELLKPTTDTIEKGVAIAKTPPTIDFLFCPEQTYNTKGNIWSNWGDGCVANGKYYSAIGDHGHPKGDAFVYEYDPAKKTIKTLASVMDILKNLMLLYVPGKIHSRVDMGSDGWLYYATHRGSGSVTNEKYDYKGDWIFKTDPKTGKSEIVCHAPVPKHCIPNSVLDPDRLIFYGGTAIGKGDSNAEDAIHFFAYDIRKGKVLCDVPNGPGRCMIFSKSTGRIYYTPGLAGDLHRYDPAKGGNPEKLNVQIGIRAATEETKDGIVYTCNQGAKDSGGSMLYAFNVKTEQVQTIGPIAVGVNQYVASLDVDPTGRYLYYIPGAHGGSDRDGSPVVQYDIKTKTRKVIAFVTPYMKEQFGLTMAGTYSTALDEKGEKLFVTWNVNRGSRAWDSCGVMTIHIPESERQP